MEARNALVEMRQERDGTYVPHRVYDVPDIIEYLRNILNPTDGIARGYGPIDIIIGSVFDERI